MSMCRSLLLLLALVGWFTASYAEPLEIKIKSPAATIRIPDIENFKLGVHPNHATQPAAQLFGRKDGVTIHVLTPTAEANTTAAQCASWLAGQVLFRYAPALDTVQFVRISESAYVLVFPLKLAGVDQLKAYIVSGNGKSHCIEVNASRTGATEQQRKEWLAGFRGVRVETQ
jgi:hypothetical protein